MLKASYYWRLQDVISVQLKNKEKNKMLSIHQILKATSVYNKWSFTMFNIWARGNVAGNFRFNLFILLNSTNFIWCCDQTIYISFNFRYFCCCPYIFVCQTPTNSCYIFHYDHTSWTLDDFFCCPYILFVNSPMCFAGWLCKNKMWYSRYPSCFSCY